MTSLPHPPPKSLSQTLPQLKRKVKHIITNSAMLCCGRKKETVDHMNQRIIGEGTSLGYTSHPQYQYYQHPSSSHHQFRRAVHFQGNTYHDGEPIRTRMPEMVLQSDFRKVSGITSEVFRQIEAVEKEFDATTAANMEAVEKRGEMIIRLLDPRQLGRAGAEAGWKYLNSSADGGHSVQFVEIIKRPGQTLGLYIREGDGFRCTEGVFISRIALESPVYNSGLLKVGDEILAVNLVDVRRMSLDDVVIIMSIPRRLVLTIRSRNRGSGVHPSVEMAGRRAFSDEYRQPPVVVVKKDLGEEESFVDDLSSNRDSENGHLLHARLKGLPAEIPPVAISLSATDSMMFGDEHGLYYNRSAMRLPHNSRDDNWTQMQQRSNDFRTRPYGVVTRQPHSLQRQYPRTIENLSEHVHQLYSGYTSDVPSTRRSGAIQVTSASVHRPMLERSSSARHRFWDDYATTGSLRRGRLLRTESDNRINPAASDYFLDQYSRPLSRGSLRSQTPTGYVGLTQMHGIRQRRSDDLRQSLSTHGISSLMRRRKITDGSVSDTEVDSITSRPHSISLRHRSVGRYPPRGRPTRDLFQNRSNSLPRTRTEPLTDYRYAKPLPFRRSQQRGQSVRFDRPFGYDEDSDGAVSAPELPDDTRARRLLGRGGPSPSGYSSDEYRQWLRRAPSTSAIYETIRRTGRSSTLPSGLSSTSLYRIAHSAESLLDTIRMEQQKSLLVEMYANKAAGKSSPLPSLLQKRDISIDSLPGKHGQRNRGHLRSHSMGLDYLRAIPNPTPVKASEHERMHLLTLNPREFFKYRYEKPTTQEVTGDTSTDTVTGNKTVNGVNGFCGILWVHLLAGRGLRSVSTATNNRDLYCVIECDRVHKARTVVRSGESSFDWDEVFELDLFETKEISFLLYSWDPQSRHKLCYKGIIGLTSLSLAETPVHSLALKMEPKGTLYVKLRYKDPATIFQRSPANSSSVSSALFGVDLETIVNRENSGFSVPLIVKRCVEEIERRGLDLVGIYRLCGSTVRKKMLRDAFEKNAWLVDLSAEHVPDINVITSLIKDYIRELPEPLFTKALFDMLVDGLSVCLPDDPAGNAKLMFSILECLPKACRCTVLHLLDHLKLIVTHSDRNKMTPQTMAICFGPLFTCHSETESLKKPVEVFKFLLEIWPIRRGSTSRSGSNDSMLDAKITNIAPISLSLESTGHKIQNSSAPMTSAVMGVSHNASLQVTSSNSDQLPLATLTPGPSPTSVSKGSLIPLTSTTNCVSDIVTSASSITRQFQQGLQSQAHYTSLSQSQPHYSSHQQQQPTHPHIQSQQYSQQQQQQSQQQQHQNVQSSQHYQTSAPGPKKSVAWAVNTHNNNGSNGGGLGNSERRNTATSSQNNSNYTDSIC